MISVAEGSPSITGRLLKWYRQAKRDLPWRGAHDPYYVWVSEMMLQQTQVTTVIPYYSRFLVHFPTVEALANATLDAVLAVWSGLGYYSRARAMHRTAAIICERYHGVFPSSMIELRELPGIGDYTAGAVLSIAYGQDCIAVDANARRVLCRLYDYADNPLAPAGKKEMEFLAQSLLPHGKAGEFNQALMELGATLCSSRTPLCIPCPLSQECLANQRGSQEERPIPAIPKPRPHKLYSAALVEDAGRLLIVRRVPRGLLGGLWELPGGELQPGEDEVSGLSRILSKYLNIDVQVGARCAYVRHIYTHFTEFLSLYRCSIHGTLLAQYQWDAAIWCLPEDLDKVGLSGITVKALRKSGYLPSAH